MPDEQNPGEEPEITAVAVNLSDIAEDDDKLKDEEPEEEVAAEEEAAEKKGGALDDIMDDIFAPGLRPKPGMYM